MWPYPAASVARPANAAFAHTPSAPACSVPVAVLEAEAEVVGVWLLAGVPVAVLEAAAEEVGVPLWLLAGVRVWLPGGVRVTLAVCDAAGERLGVADRVPLGDTVPVALVVRSGVPVALTVGVDELEGKTGRQGSATPLELSAAGTVDWPAVFPPQQVTPPAADSAHMWACPAATATWPPAAAAAGTPC